jgi:hypothetical protein
MRRPRLLIPVFGLATSLAVLIGCSSDRTGTLASKKATSTLVVSQAVPELSPVDVDPPGPSVGDRLEFTAALSIDGKPAGELNGVLTVQTPGKSNGGSVVKEERTGTLTFQLSIADSLIVNGTSKYQPSEKEMEVGDPQVRSITGGTGAYEGAKGSVTTVHNADGTYTHTLTIKQ